MAELMFNNQKGMITLEILIAMAIMVFIISSVTTVTFNNQMIIVDALTNNEAMVYAHQKLTEDDFESAVTENFGLSSGPLTYTGKNTVTDITPCLKQLNTRMDWTIESRSQYSQLDTLLGSPAEAKALGGDCSSVPPREWDNPISDVSVGIGGQGATDIDVRNNFVYLTSSPSAAPNEDFYIYEFDPIALTLTERAKIHVSPGLNGVDTIEDYAFTINNDTSDHLMVFDVSNPVNPVLFTPVSLPNTTVGIARSIFYYNGFVYIGTQYQACPICLPLQNNEFHIYDVSIPGVPVWRGSLKVNHNINDIVVRGNYAYLATSDDNGEVYIYDISNPSSILFKNSFNAFGDEDGESLYLLGNKLYLGRYRTPAARKDFYILNVEDPSNPTELGSKNLGLNPGSSVRVTGIVVKGNLAFLGLDNPTSGLQILNISDPSNIVNHFTCTTLNFSENSTAMDMDADFVFSSNNANDEIRIIRDQSSVCS